LLTPPPKRTAADWADENRILPAGSAISGPWSSALVPYTRAICEAATDPLVTYVVGVMASQTAKTETLLNIVGHRLTDGPYVPVLFVEPTEKLVRSMANDRFRKMIESTPALRERLHRGQANKVTEKFFSGIRVGFAWAGSATELASHPCGLVVMDEIDRMEADVKGEGDPVMIASARTATFWNRKIILTSTPTIDGASPVWRWFLRGTMQCWSWPCPKCTALFTPRLRHLKWPDKATAMEAREAAYVECPTCKHHIDDSDRLSLNATGQYVAHEQDDRGELVVAAEPKRSTIASFFVPGLASPFVTFGESAEQIVQAYASKNQAEIQVVINTRFGEPFVTEGQRVEISEVQRLIDIYAPQTIPHGCRLITGGIDVQKDGFYFTVRGWGYLSESWCLYYGQLYGNTDLDQVWISLSRAVEMQIAGRPIRRWMIDAGFRPGDKWRVDQHLVKKFVMKHRGRVSPSFGRAQMSGEPILRSEMQLDAAGQKVKTGIPQYVIDTDHFKQWLHARYRHPLDQQGAFHLHRDTTEAYLRHLVSEKMVIKASGHRVWLPRTGFDNHWFDCEVLARVAAVVENVDHLPPLAAEQKPLEKPAGPRDAPDDWMAGYR
jgi:phage terminase large subunit GpA-like protein